MRGLTTVLFIIMILTVLPPKIAHAAFIRLDGDFTDWVDKPKYDPKDQDETEEDGFKQVKWHLSEEKDKLYIMAVIQKPKNNGKGKITTQVKTDFGDFQAVTDYNVEGANSVTEAVYSTAKAVAGGSSSVNVMTSIKSKGFDWSDGGNWGSVMPDGSIYIEYAVPIKQVLEDMKWGYLIRFRLLNASGDAPKNSWLTVSSASTFPYIGVGACIAAGFILPAWMKRKKKE